MNKSHLYDNKELWTKLRMKIKSSVSYYNNQKEVKSLIMINNHCNNKSKNIMSTLKQCLLLTYVYTYICTYLYTLWVCVC